MAKIIDRVKEVINVLNIESENRLEYLIGQKIAELKYLQNHQSQFKSQLLHSILFLARPWLNGWIDYSPGIKISHAQYFIYAGTGNQVKSLEGFVDALSRRGESFRFLVTESLISKSRLINKCEPFRRSVIDILISAIVLIYRYGKLKKMFENDLYGIKRKYLEGFLNSYIYIPCFLRLLRESTPEFVVVSNDHSVNNRSLLAVANYLGIPTVYMQHASVSDLFPALRFTYAFLDGEKSLHFYEDCENNSPGDIREYQKPRVFLSGQKKNIYANQFMTKHKIGIAINMLDPIDAVVLLVERMKINNIDVLLRWHPRQSMSDVNKIYSAFAEDIQVRLSDPKTQDVGAFLDNVNTLIAGNSSIHLEAAIMGVRTIYYLMAPSERPDYYGYVQEGISVNAQSIDELFNMLKNKEALDIKGRNEIIKKYSESYGTKWCGREGELVVETLHRITERKELESLYKKIDKSSVFGDVYRIN